MNTDAVSERSPGQSAGPLEWVSIEHDEGRTDVAFSLRFLRDYGDRVLWVPAWRAWLVWDGCRWKRDLGDSAVIQMAESVSNAIWHEVMRCRNEQTIRYATDMSKPVRWASALKTAQAKRTVSVADLDGNRWLLNCPNGTIDLRTGGLHPHRQDDLLTTLCPTDFHPDAPAPEWERFIAGIFPSPAMRTFAQRTFGYAMTGRVHRAEEILPTLWGGGSNGKSVLIQAISETVGEDFAAPAAHGLLTEHTSDRHATERASLFGKRLVFCSETGQGSALDEDLIKALTGGDTIKARFCHRDEFSFTPTFTIFLITNHKPKVRGTDHGIWRRLLLWPFTRKFWCGWKGESGPPELQADAGLRDKLAAERPGILAWLVRGCLEWQQHGLDAPDEVRMATAEYRRSEDVIGEFIAQRCDQGPERRVKFSDFYQALTAWCEDNGEQPPSSRSVGPWLQDNGFSARQSGGRWYLGLEMKA